MTVALISDIHLGVRKNSDIFIQSQMRFLEEQFVPYLQENNITKVFWLGDIFDNRSSTNTKIMNTTFEFFDKYMKDFDSYIIVGNHDSYYNSNIKVNSLKFLNNFPNVEVIDTMKTIEIDNKKIVMVPWVVDHIKFVREFHKIESDVCMGHFNISGFHFNKYKKSEDGLQSKLFAKCKKVFSGHFHIRNTQDMQGTELVYIGSPYQLTRNDIDEKRGFTVLNLEDLSYKFIDNTKSLQYIKLKFPEKFTKNKVHNNIVDVHIDYNDSYNENKVDKYVKKIEEYNPATTPNIFVDNNAELNGDIDLENCNVGSVMELMKEYIDGLDIRNKEDIIQILINLYNEVRGDSL